MHSEQLYLTKLFNILQIIMRNTKKNCVIISRYRDVLNAATLGAPVDNYIISNAITCTTEHKKIYYDNVTGTTGQDM